MEAQLIDSNPSLVKPLEPVKSKSGMPKKLIIPLVIILLGVASGWGISRKSSLINGTPNQLTSPESITADSLKVGEIVGVPDEKSFRDKAEGVLVEGGFEGEGSHHLVRPGGDNQNVYLTSSIVDLSLFVNHKITVWGETFSAQKAGWLMDVGRVQIVELNAKLP
ncbi:hypothetical protein HZB78_01630 [Candidatus Collierbacteria bacterium]|nr:hypothetical protein [Candidatus Collierbacteria bacterium]